MAMTKVLDNGGTYGERLGQGYSLVSAVPVSSRGLVGVDRANFIKRAGASFLSDIDRLELKPGDVPVHLIAMGASEFYGPNRNGDAFQDRTLRDYHDTFQKFARWYRNHKNKDPAVSFGYVKRAAYPEEMRRVELLCILNGSKSAAERNGGLFADQELQKIAKEEDIAVSMAAKVPYDVCAACNHRARDRSEYCDEHTCTKLGCKQNLTKVAADGSVQHVLNPIATFFDISNVWRPADPTAYAAPADWLTKAASLDTPGIGGAERAELLGVTVPLSIVSFSELSPGLWSEQVGNQVKIAHGLAVLEEIIQPNGTERALDQERLAPLDLAPLGEAGTTKCAKALGALANEGVILTLQEFGELTKRAHLVAGARQALPRVFGSLVSDGDLEHRVQLNVHMPSEQLGDQQQRAWAKAAACRAVTPAAVEERCVRSRIRGEDAPRLFGRMSKTASAPDPEAGALARDYALYELGALYRIASREADFQLTADAVVRSNCL